MTLSALGLDLAWSDRNPSAGCALEENGRVLNEAALGSDAEIVAWIAEHSADRVVVAADIPLAVPNEKGMRPCERELHHVYGGAHAGPYPANRSLHRRWGRVRGEDLARLLRTAGFTDPWSPGSRVLLEVYPHPGLVEAFRLPERLSYKKGRVANRRSGLRHLAALLATLDDPPLIGPEISVTDDVGGKALKAVEDRLDARFCAWIALVWALHGRDRIRLFGDGATGHVAVPRPVTPPSGTASSW